MNPIAKLSSMLLLATAGTAALAHHSGAMFDPIKEQTLVGTVTEFNWVNPHSSFKVSVKAADGTDQLWAIEMNGPQNLVRLGWKRTTIKSGDKVSVVVHPLRDGKPGGSFVGITLPDGRKLTGTGPGQNNAYPAEPVVPAAK